MSLSLDVVSSVWLEIGNMSQLRYFLNRVQVDSACYPVWDCKMSTSQRAVMLCGWEGNRRPGGK